MTYREAYDKIIDAYFKDEIRPLDVSYCFCGTLCDNDYKWSGNCLTRHNDLCGYKGEDFVKMEKALFFGMDSLVNRGYSRGNKEAPGYEDALFAGMSAALDVLKQIHIERGEVIDEVPVFTKRQIHV